MKQPLTAFLAMLLIPASGWCTESTYTIYGNQVVTVPPAVDATNFLNLGYVSIGTLMPLDFSNVQNFTNRNVMENYFTGFRFDTAPAQSGAHKMARSFYNQASVSNSAFQLSSGTIYGASHLLISATNVVNRGLLNVEAYGLLSITGKKVDLGRSVMRVEKPFGNAGINDVYWGFGTNELVPSENIVEQYPSVDNYDVIYPPNFTVPNFMYLTDPYDFGGSAAPTLFGKEFTYEQGTNRTVQIVFVRNLNTNITIQIESTGGTPTRFGSPTIQWAAVTTNGSGVITSNNLFLTDTYGRNLTNVYVTTFGTRRPANFNLSRTGFFGGGDAGVDFADKPDDFWGDPTLVTNAAYSAYGGLITAGTTDQTVADPKLAGGRVQIVADESLDLNLSRVTAYGYLGISATNHFVGATNSTAVIDAPYADIALGSTNGTLIVDGLMPSSLDRLVGTIDIYSSVWTNTVDLGGGETNSVVFNLVMVDSDLSETVSPDVFNFSLRSTNAFIGDTLNIRSNLWLDVDNLTLLSSGTLYLDGVTPNWEDSAPHLKSLTNMGTIYTPYDLFFVSRQTNGLEQPYISFYNDGFLEGASVSVKSANAFNSGFVYSFYGPISFDVGTNLTLVDGDLYTPYADVYLSCHNLNATNLFAYVGRSITLAVTNDLAVGDNEWTVYDGFNLLTKPKSGDLLSVSVYSYAIDYQDVISTWGAADMGPSGSGYISNAALGSLTLDGGLLSQFTYTGTGPSSNALYVSELRLVNYATNRDAGGNLSAVKVNPGMKIYFATAYLDDGVGGLTDITSELDGKNGGAFASVPLPSVVVPVTLNPELRISVERVPQERSLISWDTMPLSTNSLYGADQPYNADWQLLTNFVAGAAGGSVTISDPAVSESRFYKVKVDLP